VLATIGIQPSRPETGYGYVETGTPFATGESIKAVKMFHEKPGPEKAKQYQHAGNYLWNSGMFFWRLDTFSESMAKCLPEVGSKINVLKDKYIGKTELALDGPFEDISSEFSAFPNESIDYGLMEKADNVVVARADFSWDDIGSWDSLDRIRPRDADGNIHTGPNAAFGNKNSLIINESKDGNMMVSVFGMEDTVVVVTDDSVMVCPKNRVQEVKKSVEMIREKGGDKWL
jgi:mannose-1-phosphate guanylyltransferase